MNRIHARLSIAAATLTAFAGYASAWPAPDCFSRGAAGALGTCSTPTYARPVGTCSFICGPANSVADATECVADWDGDGCVTSADVAAYITCFFCSTSNGLLDADIDCNLAVTPADVAVFVVYWSGGISAPVFWGC